MRKIHFLIFSVSFIALFSSGCAAVRLITGDPTPEQEHRDFVESYRERLNNAAQAHDIALGMDMHQVQNSWGSPGDVETAGNPDDGNARWIYYQGLSNSVNGRRIIYFEQGQVVGWETSSR